MVSPTQTMENTTEVEYISIYDKPKRGRGRPKTCKLSDEEKRQRNRDNATRYHYDNYEYCKMRQRLQKQTAYVSKNEVQKTNYFFGFLKNNFHLNNRHYYIEIQTRK